jgi:hypothetical protein
MPEEFVYLALGAVVFLQVTAFAVALWRRRGVESPPSGERDARPAPAVTERGEVRCRHCETVNDPTYRYCRECVEPLPVNGDEGDPTAGAVGGPSV